jgi:murein L,D-transpeptidase YafK
MIQFALGMTLGWNPNMSKPFDRAGEAKQRVETTLKAKVREVGLSYPPQQLFFRAFKEQKVLEIWGGNSSKDKLRLIEKYDVLAASGKIGPKRASGDLQVPEGWYFINRFNPQSRFHLSLGLNYPNKSDLALTTAKDPGGDIFIHGNQLSIGCLAMGDPAIEEIYTLARAAKNKVYVLILPSRKIPSQKTHGTLWKQIYGINKSFLAGFTLPKVNIDEKGNYVLD